MKDVTIMLRGEDDFAMRMYVTDDQYSLLNFIAFKSGRKDHADKYSPTMEVVVHEFPKSFLEGSE